jgi:hypothetical protein
MDAAQLIASLNAEQVAAVYAIRDSILAQHATAEAAFVSVNQELRSQIADLDTALDTEQALTATLQARIAALEAIRQFNPRHITPEAFLARFTSKEGMDFGDSQDAMILGGKELLRTYEAEGYHVDLDDTQVQGLTGYMVQVGMLTTERREQVLRDATAAEAYYA